ncbi:lysozyme inhibitor LprI family protein [Dyella lutea]|uniref:Lysozyme inhibitor LprI family protein n=1 Tax=Dyella lutea TaxID=2950441 RepID=A0ABT1FAK6_9GAMM|nr:lysozyme inhibitor LprI family protein [Dyella lutea]MCP1374394.1 lysozyme inhibitor LprI family protein [Dyella lutea]
MRFVALVALVILAWLMAAPVRADQPPADNAVVAKFCAKAASQYDMNQCAGRVGKAADEELNATYQAVLRKWAAYPKMIAKLRQAQRAWLSYRDADLAARFADSEGPDRGTAFPAAYALYQASLERERTARLCDYLRGDAYGEQDSAPCPDLVRHPFVVPKAP